MDCVAFKEQNVIYAENQPEYLPLPAYKTEDGVVTSCWKLNILERIKIFIFGKIYLQSLTFNQPLQPLKMSLNKPLERLEEGRRGKDARINRKGAC